jgi:hypothetical protein
MVSPPANIVGGSSVPLGRPVVPDVYSRLGLGVTVPGGSTSAPPASHSSHSMTPSGSAAPGGAHPTTVPTPAVAAASSPRPAVSGPTNSTAVPESPRM